MRRFPADSREYKDDAVLSQDLAAAWRDLLRALRISGCPDLFDVGHLCLLVCIEQSVFCICVV